jgi:hypothetical protein
MPDITPDYKTQIEILTEMVLDLYAKNAALANTTLGIVSNPDSLRETEQEAWGSLSRLPAIENLVEKVETSTLEAAKQALRDFRL